MNNHLIIIFTFALFIIACSEEKVQVISNTPPDLPDQNYKLNLQSDSGENLDSVTISWNETSGEVELMDSNTPIPSTGNSHKFSGMIPGEFRNILLMVIENNLIDIDSIQIFTRTVSPVSYFEFELDAIKVGENVFDEGELFDDLGNGIYDEGELFDDLENGIYDEGELFDDLNNNGSWDEGELFDDLGNEIYDEGELFDDLGNGIYDEGEVFYDKEKTKYHRNLIWSPTLESNEKFLQYIIYRSDDPFQLIFPDTCNCKLDSLSLLSDSTYIDSSSEVIDNLDPKAFYYSIQVSAGDFTRNSSIYNYTNFDQLESIQLTEANVSINKNKFIAITWEPIPITDSDYFYQYEIWRASNEEFSDKTLITIITDSNQGKFMDRDVGNGITWYYSVVVVDISGRKFSSDIVSGWSIP